jgi:hypothetical protein
MLFTVKPKGKTPSLSSVRKKSNAVFQHMHVTNPKVQGYLLTVTEEKKIE